MKTNETEIYEEKYKNGYGHIYPESHIIRIYERFIKQNLVIDTHLKILDYGCGTGANLHFFKDKGFDTFGCDVSKSAIEKCKSNPIFDKNKFEICNEVPNPLDLFGNIEFDLILSNQTLYYLSDESLRKFVEESYKIIKDNGFLVVTMMAKSHWFYSHKVSHQKSLHTVDLRKSRFNQLSYINFKEKEDLEEIFYPFKKCLTGFYTLDLLPDEGPTDHWIYICKKE